MTECSKIFRRLGTSYGQLYRSSFNADPVSLKNIETYPYILVLSYLRVGVKLVRSEHVDK